MADLTQARTRVVVGAAGVRNRVGQFDGKAGTPTGGTSPINPRTRYPRRLTRR